MTTARIFAFGTALLLLSACDVIKSDLLGRDGAPSDGSADMPEPGLILRYTFEDTATAVLDVSGHHFDGTASDAGVWIPGGRIGRGLGLTGTQYVSLPSGALAGVDDFTIATWVRLTTMSDWQRIYDFGNAAGDRFMYLTISGYEPRPPAGNESYDGVHLSSYGGSVENENWLGTKTRLPTLVWKHLAVTGSGGNRRLYIDGFPAAVRAEGPIGGANVPPREMEPLSPNSWLGKSRASIDPGLRGALDEFRIYNHVLTASEIADLAWPQRDYSYWRFDETSGASAKDSSDNAIAAALMGDLTWTKGRLGGAVKLPGGPPGPAGPHITLASSPLAKCTEFTVATWIKLDALDSSRIFDFGTGTGSYIYLAVTDGTGLHFGMAAPGKPPFDLTTPSQPLTADGVWHHVAVTLLSGVARLYVDGGLVASQGGTSIRPSDLGATTQNWLGQSRADDRYLSASLDELRIACRAYTDSEITNLSRP